MAKGQWFLLSAVIASATFLSISLMYKGYLSIDSSEAARINEDFFFMNIVSELNRTFSYSAGDGELCWNFIDFYAYASQKAMNSGYSLSMANKTPISKSGTDFSINLSSHTMNITRNVRLP